MIKVASGEALRYENSVLGRELQPGDKVALSVGIGKLSTHSEAISKTSGEALKQQAITSHQIGQNAGKNQVGGQKMEVANQQAIKMSMSIKR